MMGLLIEISLPDLCVDTRSRAMCLFLKHIKKYIIMSFNANNLPSAPQSREISDSYNRDYNHKVWMDRHVQESRQGSRELPYMATQVSYDLFPNYQWHDISDIQ